MDHYISFSTHESFFLLISTLPTYKYHLVGDRKSWVPLVARVGELEWALPGGGNPISAIYQQPPKTRYASIRLKMIEWQDPTFKSKNKNWLHDLQNNVYIKVCPTCWSSKSLEEFGDDPSSGAAEILSLDFFFQGQLRLELSFSMLL